MDCGFCSAANRTRFCIHRSLVPTGATDSSPCGALAELNKQSNFQEFGRFQIDIRRLEQFLGCHCWLVQQCRFGKHCWTSQQWHPERFRQNFRESLYKNRTLRTVPTENGWRFALVSKTKTLHVEGQEMPVTQNQNSALGRPALNVRPTNSEAQKRLKSTPARPPSTQARV
jgi:hypothetical protein